MKEINNQIGPLIIQDIVADGKGKAVYNDETFYVIGAFPDETVNVEIVKKKKNEIQCIVSDVIKSSPFRQKAKEEHYLSCSPWQVINYHYQIQLKKYIIKKVFHALVYVDIDPILEYDDKNLWHYRTKVEYSFAEIDKKVFLAFHKPTKHNEYYILDHGCCLFDDDLNNKALELLELIRLSGLEKYDLKSIVIRKSFNFSDTSSILLAVKNKKDRVINSLEILKKFNFPNFVVVHSSYKTPITTIDEILLKNGQENIREKILDKVFEYGYLSFFQNNITLFEKTLLDIKNYLERASFKIKPKAVELYSGVGTIGLSLAEYFSQLVAFEIDDIAVKYSLTNAKLNNVSNFYALPMPAEKVKIFDENDVLIVDPPRSGLHTKLIKRILESKPRLIIYLSCNVTTLARDVGMLNSIYDIDFIRFYDYYPQTPHVEGLCILKRKI